MRSDLAVFVLVACCAQRAFTQFTSLYIPGFDPQPISADILGVDSEGRTTWALHAGTPTGTFRSQDSFPGTVTVVEGANDAVETYVDVDGGFTAGETCTFSGGLAICNVDVNGTPDTETETVSPFAVQLGSTAVITGGADSSPTGSSTSSSQTSSGGSSSRASSNPGSASAASPTQGNSSFKNTAIASSSLLLGIITLFTVALL